MARIERRTSQTASNDNADSAPEIADDCRDVAVAGRESAEVNALGFAGQLLTWGLRNWVRAFKSDLDFEAATEGTFTRFGLTVSATALDRAMSLLAAATTRMIDIRCVPCRYLSPDELTLIDAVAAAQQEGYFLATVALRKLVPGTAARAMLPYVVELARDLQAAGMRVQPITPAMLAAAEAIAVQAASAPGEAVPSGRTLH
jgi:hypothetical protein